MTTHATVIRVVRLETERVKAAERHNCRTTADVLNVRQNSIDAYKNVEPEYTRFNRILVGTRSLADDIAAANGSTHAARSDSHDAAAEFVLSMNKQFYAKMTYEEQLGWCEDAVSALDKYCRDNNRGYVINAVAHFDEDTPHVHAITSIKTEVFNNQGKSRGELLSYGTCWSNKKSEIISARKNGTLDKDIKLSHLQTEYTTNLQELGWDVCRGTIDSKAKHKEQAQYHKEQEEIKIREFTVACEKIKKEAQCAYEKLKTEKQKIIEIINQISEAIKNGTIKKETLTIQSQLLNSLINVTSDKTKSIEKQTKELIAKIDNEGLQLLTAIKSKKMRMVQRWNKIKNNDTLPATHVKMR